MCDSENHRIQVFAFDEDLNLLRVIGRKGAGNRCLTDLDFDEAGNIYITEQGNHRIQVLTPEGQHIRIIGRGPGRAEVSNLFGSTQEHALCNRVRQQPHISVQTNWRHIWSRPYPSREHSY